MLRVSTLLRSVGVSGSNGLKIVVLGATGDTGKPLVEQALAAGHQVTAVVRDPSKVSKTHANLNIVQGDVFKAESLQPHLLGQDALVSVLGFPKQMGPVSDFTRSMQAIVVAMRNAHLRRLVTISAWYNDPVTRVGQGGWEGMWSKVPGLINTVNNEGEMDVMLAGMTKDVDYTSVRVPTLTWDPDTRKPFMVAPDAHWVDDGSFFLPRADVARFMLSTLQGPEQFKGKAVSIAIKYTDEEMQAAAVRFKEHMAMYTDKGS